ncbi:MAG: AraC family ligand binding domain-containing protein [Blastocatellia bacterium]|nr:AraC family ligand binding domain-containing protein [Blastocatellia bacterium]
MPAWINQRLELAGLTLTETEYAQKPTDWHSHECPHLTLITRGEIQAGTRRAIWECPADTLLFHNRQEPHYSRKPASATRGFQVGISLPWSRNFELSWESLPDSARLTHPGLKLLFYHIYKEARQADDASGLAIEALLIDLLATMRGVAVEAAGARPAWVARADEILRDEFAQPPSLRALSTELNLHWAHLSREFPRYFPSRKNTPSIAVS